MKAVQTNPEDRFASAAELRDALLKPAEPILKDHVFEYEVGSHKWEPYAAASAILAVIDLGLTAINPIPLLEMLLFGMLPFLSTVPAVLYREIKKRADVRIMVREADVTYFEKTSRIRASWDDVESLAFITKREGRGGPIVSEVEVRTRKGKFSYDTSLPLHGGISLALKDHHRLTEIIIRKGHLRQKTHGSNIYTRES